MTAEILNFIAGMIKLEMVASVLLLLIAVSVVGVLGSVMWFIVTKLPKILQDWLVGFNAAVEKLAESVVRITADVGATHQNTVAYGLVLSSHDEQARQIMKNTELILEKQDEQGAMLIGVVTTLENRPCIAKR